jgi:hypothetical protein
MMNCEVELRERIGRLDLSHMIQLIVTWCRD